MPEVVNPGISFMNNESLLWLCQYELGTCTENNSNISHSKPLAFYSTSWFSDLAMQQNIEAAL